MKRVGMSGMAYFGFLIVTLIGLIAAFNVQLVDDIITNSGYSSAEVFTGIFFLVFIFDTIVFAVSRR